MKTIAFLFFSVLCFGQTPTAFFSLAPCRIADTRSTAYPAGLGAPALTAGVQRSFPVLASTCNVPATATAYSLNITAVPTGPLGFLAVFPSGQTLPTVSTLNAPAGAITANAAIVGAGTGGAVTIYATNTTNVVIDINGYFGPMANIHQMQFTTNAAGVSTAQLPSAPAMGVFVLFRNGMFENPQPTGAANIPDYTLNGLTVTLTLPVQLNDGFIAVY